MRNGIGPDGVLVEVFEGSCSLRGLVLEPSGKPLSRVALYVISDVGGWKVEEPRHATEDDGTFSIPGLPCGRGELHVNPPRDRHRSRTVDFAFEDPETGMDLGEIALEEAGDRSVTFKLAYLDPDADPELGMIDLTLRRLDERGSHFSRMVGGKARFEDLDPGLYQPEVSLSVHLPPKLDPVDLREREHVEVEVPADPGVTIHGDLTLAEGFPRQGTGGDLWLPIRLHYAEGGQLNRIARLDSGRYRVQGLRKGRVTKLTVIAAPPGERATYVELPGFSIDRRDQDIPLGRVELPRGDVPKDK